MPAGASGSTVSGPTSDQVTSFVQCLLGKAIERFDTHPGIYQDVVDFGWSNNSGLRSTSERAKQNNNNNNKEENKYARSHRLVYAIRDCVEFSHAPLTKCPLARSNLP